MNTLEAIAKRKSTRNYKPEQIPEDALQAILKAGIAAPVAMAKYDSLHITVVQNPEILAKINAATADMLFKVMGVRKRILAQRPLFSCPPFLRPIEPVWNFAMWASW